MDKGLSDAFTVHPAYILSSPPDIYSFVNITTIKIAVGLISVSGKIIVILCKFTAFLWKKNFNPNY